MTHEEVIELLPWYVNATLNESERHEIGAHLAGCASCRAELDEMALLQTAVLESSSELPMPSEPLLQDALRNIDSYERGRERQREAAAAQQPGIGDRIRRTFADWFGPMPNFARAVMATQLVLILGLAGGLGYLMRERDYTTLSGSAQADGQAKLAVRFHESVTEAEMRGLLREIGGRFVDGPSAQGIYTVELQVPSEKSQEVEKILQILRSRQPAIAYAEKLG